MTDKKPIERAREARRAMFEQGIKPEHLDPVEKARRNPKSLRLAIDGKCWDCVGGDADPGPRQRVRDCNIKLCTLWPVRPWQHIKGASGYLDA